jgi:hypothetical protein
VDTVTPVKRFARESETVWPAHTAGFHVDVAGAMFVEPLTKSGKAFAASVSRAIIGNSPW